MNDFKPFQNESQSLKIAPDVGDLTIENRIDRVSLFGSLDITKDKIGLAAARDLKTILDLVVAELERSDLPEKIEIIPPETVKNPFQ
jgi:hypothetical protein